MRTRGASRDRSASSTSRAELHWGVFYAGPYGREWCTGALLAAALAGCGTSPPGDDALYDSGPVEEHAEVCFPSCLLGETCSGGHCVPSSTTPFRDAGNDLGRPVDATATDVPVIVDAVAPVACCRLGTPSCGCVFVGGAVDSNGDCHQICDIGQPDAWVRAVDPHGCAYWATPHVPCPVDAGSD